MNETEKLAWIARRLTFGGPALLADWSALEPADVVDRLVDPEGHGVPATEPIWAGIDVPEEVSAEDVIALANTWLSHLSSSTRPLEAWLTWFWHDYFAVAANQTRALYAFTGHVELLQAHSLGRFDALLRDVTTDPGMLVFLDGVRNARGQVNENYGRELLELYGLGFGHYTEADVRAAAVALSGWVWRPGEATSLFLARRHDPTPQNLFGERVSDVDGVIAAVTAHPACAIHVGAALSTAILGRTPAPAVLERLATGLRESGFAIAPTIRTIIDLAFDGEQVPVVLSPLQWLLAGERLTGEDLPGRVRLGLLRQMGLTPGVPPDVGGYPGAETWAGPSATVGRFRAAGVLAARAPSDSAVLGAAQRGDWAELARLAARPAGFSATTLAALDQVDTSRNGGRDALAAVLNTPDLVVA